MSAINFQTQRWLATGPARAKSLIAGCFFIFAFLLLGLGINQANAQIETCSAYTCAVCHLAPNTTMIIEGHGFTYVAENQDGQDHHIPIKNATEIIDFSLNHPPTVAVSDISGSCSGMVFEGKEYVGIFKNGICWLDRNLGATRACTSSADSSCYGDLYQWGRLTDGHQIRTSSDTYTLSSTDIPGHGNYIASYSSPYDWRNPQNSGLWQGVAGINNPCPSGWRLPTQAEVNSERLSWNTNNASGAYNSVLKFGVGGYSDTGSALTYVGAFGVIWSSTVSATGAYYLGFHASDAVTDLTGRAAGLSVRCVK